MTRVQKCILWLLRYSHYWERPLTWMFGQRFYSAVKSLVWKIYFREAGRRPKD